MTAFVSTLPCRDVLTLGETMLRLSPAHGKRLSQETVFEMCIAGSESNVAGALCVLGKSVTWVSRLPSHALGRKIAADLRAHGVDVSAIVWTPPTERVGLLYYEPSVPSVVYDRAKSAASFLSPGDLPETLFTTHRHLHMTGITPALSASCTETAAYTVERARRNGMTVSFDVNYRAKLWPPSEAAAALAPLMAQADIIICSRDDARLLFDCTGEAATQAHCLWERFRGPDIVLTAGADGAVGCAAGGCVAVPAVPMPFTVERLGSGDAFVAGYLAGFLEAQDMEQSLRLGAATAALKRTVLGDLLIGNRAEVEALLLPEE